jgi:hypothetical protein
VIRDETKRVRQPAAWLLLVGVTISVFLGLMAMLSNGWAVAANAAALFALGSDTSGPSFADRSVVAAHVFLAVPVAAMAVVAVILATHLGDKVPQARRITLFAVVLQGTALLFGVITWLVGLGAQTRFGGSEKLGFFLDAAAGIAVAVAGLLFSVVTLRSRELQAARSRSAAQPASPAVYPGYSYGPQATGAPGVGAGGYAATPTYQSGPAQTQQPGQQTPSQQASQPTAQYPASTSQQYGPAAGSYGQQQSYGSYGQQASAQQGYSAGYGQQSYQQGYDSGYGQQAAYGQNYGSYSQGYGQQAQPESYQQPAADGFRQTGTNAESYTEGYQQSAQPAAETYQQSAQPAAETYQQYYQQSHGQADHAGSENSQPGHSPDDGDSRDSR